MGLFLHLSTIISTPKKEVLQTIKDIYNEENTPLKPVIEIDESKELLIVNYSNKSTNIFFPPLNEHWDISKDISIRLKTAVLTLEIHDGDFWFFVLYDKGEEAIKFNPYPEYYDENITESEIKSWLPNVDIFCNYFPNVKSKDIEKYFINWKLNDIKHWTEESILKKAYSKDKYGYGDGLQLFDFIDKLGIKNPIDSKNNIKGNKFQINRAAIEISNLNPFKIARDVLEKSIRYQPDFISISEEEFEYLTGDNYARHLNNYSGTLFCSSCQERHLPVKIESGIVNSLTVELFGECTKCGDKCIQLVSLFYPEKIIKLFEY